MNILFIDTAEGTRALLLVGDRAYYDENLSNAGSETLMPMIDGLLKRADLSVDKIDKFGACIGPGSFTGLRVGLTTVKTLCYALGKPCFAVNKLRLNSYNNSSGKVISIADAGNKVCYIARYDGQIETESARCVTLADAMNAVSRYPDHAVSTDIKLFKTFDGTVGAGERELRLAIERHADDTVSYNELEPLYIRKAQPERGEGDL